MPAPANLVHETSTSTGTGNFTISAVNGKNRFSTAFGTSGTNVFDYFISNQSAAEWERGTGHMSAVGTLVRDTVKESTNANALVSFSAGTKDVTNDIPALLQARLDAANVFTDATASSGVGSGCAIFAGGISVGQRVSVNGVVVAGGQITAPSFYASGTGTANAFMSKIDITENTPGVINSALRNNSVNGNTWFGVYNDATVFLFGTRGDDTVTDWFTIADAVGTNILQAKTDQVAIRPTTGSTSSTTGALTVAGGLGVAGATYLGSVVNIAGSGNPLVINSVDGGSSNTTDQILMQKAGVTIGSFGGILTNPLFVRNAAGYSVFACTDDTGGGTIAGRFTFHAVGTGQPLVVNATGTDTDISINIVPKGAGVVNINGSQVVSAAGGATMTGGLKFTPYNAGSFGNGNTFTPNPVNGNYQYATNTAASGAVTIAAPTVDCAIDILWTNTSSAVVVPTFSGFTANATVSGAPPTAANAKCIISIRRINAVATYSVMAMQ